jgi:Domain of unknown function (DUF6602)
VKFSDQIERIEESLLAKFRETEAVQHYGDKGESRELLLREFLEEHLPRRYGVTKGEIVTRAGDQSHSADVIVYDAVNCPVLYSGATTVLPVEGVYGIIEVKSTMSKGEFVDAARKIEAFKRLAPRDLSVIQTREYVTVHRPSRPFGIAFGYSLGDNSLTSLRANFEERHREVHDVNFFVNLLVVLAAGLVHLERVDLPAGEKHLLLHTDEAVNFILAERHRAEQGETSGQLLRTVQDDAASRTFGRFFVYLLIMLERMRLGFADLGQYLDPTLPLAVYRES